MDQETTQGKAEQGAGYVKEKVGQVTGDPALQAQGQNEQDAGKLHETFGNARGKMKEGASSLKEKASVMGERIRDAAHRAGHRDEGGMDQTNQPK